MGRRRRRSRNRGGVIVVLLLRRQSVAGDDDVLLLRKLRRLLRRHRRRHRRRLPTSSWRESEAKAETLGLGKWAHSFFWRASATSPHHRNGRAKMGLSPETGDIVSVHRALERMKGMEGGAGCRTHELVTTFSLSYTLSMYCGQQCDVFTVVSFSPHVLLVKKLTLVVFFFFLTHLYFFIFFSPAHPKFNIN